jgi:transcriptional regulator with XRE-family HTH domain
MTLTALQSKMARAALGLGVRELADLAKVSPDTVARFERGDELKDRTVESLQRALEAAGVEFTNGSQPGVRLKPGTKAWVNDKKGSAYRITNDNKVFSTRSGAQIGTFVGDRIIDFNGRDLGGLKSGPSIPIEEVDTSNDE